MRTQRKAILVGALVILDLILRTTVLSCSECIPPNPPRGGGTSRTAKAYFEGPYTAWCTRCGGTKTYNYNNSGSPGCIPGPNWGGKSSGGSSGGDINSNLADIFTQGMMAVLEGASDKEIGNIIMPGFAGIMGNLLMSTLFDTPKSSNSALEQKRQQELERQQPQFTENPVWKRSYDSLNSHQQIPPNAAQTALLDALGGQTCFFNICGNPNNPDLSPPADRVAPYRPEEALQQLRLSACLSQGAAKLDSGKSEEAHWLLKQGSRASNGDYVEAIASDCDLPTAPPIPEPKVVEVSQKRSMATEKVMEMFAAAQILEKKRDETKQEVEKAKKAVKEWEEKVNEIQNMARVMPEEKVQEQSLLAEAQAALAEAKKNHEKVEAMAQKADKELNQAIDKAKRSADQLNRAGSDPDRLDDLLGQFK